MEWLIEQNLQQRNRRPSEYYPSTPMTSNERESGLSRIPELILVTSLKMQEEGSFKVMFGKSMTFMIRLLWQQPLDVPERVWGTISSTNFELRVGPNYAWNKKRTSSTSIL